MCLERYGIRQFSSRRLRCFFLWCLPSAFKHGVLGHHLCRLPSEKFSICHAHVQKTPGDSTPFLKRSLSLSLTAFSETFIKETGKEGGRNVDKVLSSISYQELQPTGSQMPGMARRKGFSFTLCLLAILSLSAAL